MRYVLLISFLLFAWVLTACSFSTEFVVVNESEHSVQVRYKTIRDPGRPVTLAASQLLSHEWRELHAERYVYDSQNRTVTISLNPGEAVRITITGNGELSKCIGVDDQIKEIDLLGVSGEVSFRGDQVHKNFGVEPKPFYSLSKNTICSLRYR